MNITELISNQGLYKLSKVFYQIGNNYGYRVNKEEFFQLIEIEPLILKSIGKVLGVASNEEVYNKVSRRQVTLKHVYWSLSADLN